MEKDVNVQVVNEQDGALHEGDIAQSQAQQLSDKELNFKAMREQVDQLKMDSARKDQIIAELQRGMKQTKKTRYVDGDPDEWTTNGSLDNTLTNVEQEILSKVEQMLIQEKYPNVQELITKYGNEIPASVASVISQSKNLKAAMDAIKMTPSYLRDHAKDHVSTAKAIETANKPKSTMGVGVTGSVSKSTKYRSMSRAERLELQKQFMRG